MRLQVNNISKTFIRPDGGSVLALAPTTFSVFAGEFVCIVGPSGCGKSTLFNVIAGLEKPQTGNAKVDGKLGLMFQESALFPWLTVEQNVGFGLDVQRVNKVERDAKVKYFLELVRLQQFATAYPHELSGGMKQRASLARSLILDPDVLLMDEPFGALDAQSRELLHQQLQDIWSATRKTIIFVTHDVREAVFLGTRVMIFSARPGTLKKEIEINLTRPRDLNDPQVDALTHDIKRELHAEISKAVATQENLVAEVA